MKNYKKNKMNIHWFRILDLLLLVIFPILMTLITLILSKYSTKYTIILVIITVIILLINAVSFLLKTTIITIIRRVLMSLLCIALAFAYLQLKDIHHGVSKVFIDDFNEEVELTTTYQILALKDHPNQMSKASDLDALKVGYISRTNEDMSFIKKELDKDAEGTRSLSYTNTTNLLTDYYNFYIDAIIIDKDNKSELTSSYPTLFEDSVVLKTFKHTSKVNTSNQNNIDITSNVFTVLISANDEVGSPEEASLSDMNMLLIINPIDNHITTVSIPRDSYIPDPANAYQNDKLTHTGWDGITNTVAAVENLFQIEVDFYVKISFTSLIEIVNTLDGIESNVAIDFCEQNENRQFGENEICLNAGYQHLNGQQALAYARHRHDYIDQDIGRNAAQTDVIVGIIKKMASIDGISKIDDVLNVLSKYFLTNFSNKQITSFVKQQVDDLKEWNVSSFVLDGNPDGSAYSPKLGDYANVYYLSKSKVEQVHLIYMLQKQTNSFKDLSFELDNLAKDSQFYEDLSEFDLVP